MRLPEDAQVKDLDDLRRVQIVEDASSDIHFRNLSVPSAPTIEDAFNLLFIGEVNRSVSA